MDEKKLTIDEVIETTSLIFKDAIETKRTIPSGQVTAFVYAHDDQGPAVILNGDFDDDSILHLILVLRSKMQEPEIVDILIDGQLIELD